MAQEDFADQLLALGYSVESLSPGRIILQYEIPLGRLRGYHD